MAICSINGFVSEAVLTLWETSLFVELNKLKIVTLRALLNQGAIHDPYGLMFFDQISEQLIGFSRMKLEIVINPSAFIIL